MNTSASAPVERQGSELTVAVANQSRPRLSAFGVVTPQPQPFQEPGLND